MKLSYSQQHGYVDNDTSAGVFTVMPVVSFQYDTIWYDEHGDSFIGVGWGRQKMTDAQIAEIRGVIPNIVIIQSDALRVLPAFVSAVAPIGVPIGVGLPD